MKSKSKKLAPTRKPAASAAKTPDAILAAFRARPGTFRAKLVARLARDLGRPVAAADLRKAVYGGGPSGGLSNALAGIDIAIAKHKPGYRIAKIGEGDAATYTLSVAR